MEAKIKPSASISLAERVGFEPTVGYKPTPIFKTGAINQLDHLSICFCQQHIYISTQLPGLSMNFLN